jgi:hypothetical protein
MNRLLAGGIAAILVTGFAPHALDIWRERGIERERAEQQRTIETKEREIACLERLAEEGIRPGTKVEAEIDRCRREAAASSGP